jgi:hypothetical protein
MSGTLRIAKIDGQANDLIFKTTTAAPLYTFEGSSTTSAEIRLDTSNNNYYTALKSSNLLASNVTLTLPVNDGTNGDVLKVNGAGELYFESPSVIAGHVMQDPSSIYVDINSNWLADNALTRTVGGTSQIQPSNWYVADNGDLYSDSGDLILDADATGAPASAIYFGSKTSPVNDEHWRIRVVSATNRLVFEQRTGGNWVEQGAFSA